ncbi:MAG: hypothetical protein HZB44_06250 [Actinobacteria bacterium]|nr:hypothetical protein [Actinomycetota bacterium]
MPKVKNRNRLPVFLGLLALLMAGLIFMASRMEDDGMDLTGGAGGQSDTAMVEPRTLADVPRARFLSIFVSDDAGNLASYMVGGGTPEYDAFAGAISGAQPEPGASDETFTDLLVVSFGTNDSLELSYSPSRNRFILDDVLYQPAADLSPMITDVEKRFD